VERSPPITEARTLAVSLSVELTKTEYLFMEALEFDVPIPERDVRRESGAFQLFSAAHGKLV